MTVREPLPRELSEKEHRVLNAGSRWHVRMTSEDPVHAARFCEHGFATGLTPAGKRWGKVHECPFCPRGFSIRAAVLQEVRHA